MKKLLVGLLFAAIATTSGAQAWRDPKTSAALGTPTSGVATNLTGLPLTTGVTGVLGTANGGTGIANNAASTITVSGSYATTLTVSGVTGVTLPTSGTLATTTQASSGSGAEQTISYQPGLLTAVNATKGVFGKFVKTSTVDNIIASAITFSCVANPTITMYECGTTVTCDSSPTTIGTVTLTAAGTAVAGTINSATITAGDYVAWAMTAGTCASVDLSATAQVHAN